MEHGKKALNNTATPLDPSASAATYVVLQESASPASVKKDWQETLGPSLLPFIGALIAVAVPLVVKWIADKRERRLVLTREIYLKVMDAVTEAGEALGMVASPEVGVMEIAKKLSSAFGAISKAEVVASMPLVRSLAQLETTLGTFMAELFSKRVEMESIEGGRRATETYLAKLHEQIEANFADLSRLVADGEVSDKFNRLKETNDSLQREFGEAARANEANYAARQKIIEAIATRAIEMRGEIVPLHAKVIELMRHELDISGFNISDYLFIKRNRVAVAKQAIGGIQEAVTKVASEGGGGNPA
jgi:hypothetical protein